MSDDAFEEKVQEAVRAAAAKSARDRQERPKRAREALQVALAAQAPTLHALLDRVNEEWAYEDGIYRFYHQSFKAYRLQEYTTEIIRVLQGLLPWQLMDERFLRIVAEGTGKTFHQDHNVAWDYHVRPIVEAFFHARYFLEMAVKHANHPADGPLASGYAAFLTLFRAR